ncbi:MAG: hypothetical protein IJ721_07960 [Bacteroidales bacterium]|nr:hypothetical protein [Bacteroidales bacterium]
MTNSQQAVYDARTLGRGKMLTLGLQHMFAMFGATVLVPVITGLSMSATLLFAGLGTLIFHLCTKMRVPAFLGSSFAFLGGYAAVVSMGASQGLSTVESLPYACIGVFCAGIFYFVLAGLFAAFVGIFLNAVLPGKDYEFGTNQQGDTSVDFEVNRVQKH